MLGTAAFRSQQSAWCIDGWLSSRQWMTVLEPCSGARIYRIGMLLRCRGIRGLCFRRKKCELTMQLKPEHQEDTRTRPGSDEAENVLEIAGLTRTHVTAFAHVKPKIMCLLASLSPPCSTSINASDSVTERSPQRLSMHRYAVLCSSYISDMICR